MRKTCNQLRLARDRPDDLVRTRRTLGSSLEASCEGGQHKEMIGWEIPHDGVLPTTN